MSKPACWQKARAQCYQLRRATLRPPDLMLPASPSQGFRLLDIWGWSWLWGIPLGVGELPLVLIVTTKAELLRPVHSEGT